MTWFRHFFNWSDQAVPGAYLLVQGPVTTIVPLRVRKIAAQASYECPHGRVERHGFEYHRQGTLSLSLDVRTGKVQGKTAACHTSEEFVNFLQQVVGGCKPKQEVHVILDNPSAHKMAKVQEFLDEHTPRAPALSTNLFFLAESG